MSKCKTCKGRGQTKECRTVFHFEKATDKHGKTHQKYVTDSLGSGCLICEGTGSIETVSVEQAFSKYIGTEIEIAIPNRLKES